MRTVYLTGVTALLSLLLIAASPDKKPRGQGGGAGVEPAEVPEYLFNTWLCRPGADSVTISVLAWVEMEAFVSYGEKGEALSQRSFSVKLAAGEPQSIVLGKLKPDTAYSYQLTYRRSGAEPVRDELRSFHTQRARSSTFTFTTQADSHLDTNTDTRVYERTLANMLADNPDFTVDLGDTTMVDKFGKFYTRSESQYRAQRYCMGEIAHSVPILLTLGNHDGEKAERLTGDKLSMPLWSVANRKKFFPNPEPGGIYSGNAMPQPDAGLLQDYYAWEWGNAFFIVLDPFWFSRERSDENWGMTLGEEQYRWLTTTLEKTKASFKFVFIHHLVGGKGRDVRGGVAAAPFMEWGGKNEDGTDGSKKHRPGWAMPIHQLLMKNHVSIVFHGHDHLFVKEELDGIIYQEVPQPGHPSGGTRSAEEYGYNGVTLGSSGHVRVTVGPKEAKVDYVRAIVPGVTRDSMSNGTVEHSYVIQAR